ncbi:CHAP domain-containing protein [Aerococcaceae bacterium DSM 111020]|nr:CHAP domain-containing protein [Aerococcaceae bacterium DSM 111020]
MDLTYQNVTLPAEIVEHLIKEAERLSVPPSYLITKLHFEGVWGKSNVARQDNNWSGMTWTGDPKRPSGVVVGKGSARPANEGGHYMRYKNVDDFFKDWLHLIRRGGIYKVADSATFDKAVQGMFRYGGAKYDYATMNLPESQSKQRYEAYLRGMKARREAINQSNDGALDKLDKGVDYVAVTATQMLAEARKWIGSNKYGSNHKKIVDGYNQIRPLPMGYKVTYNDDWCDTFVSFVSKQVGALGLTGAECGVERHKNIFKQKGIWLGIKRPKAGDIIIFQWNGQRNGWAHHIGFVESVSGDYVTTIEGNTVKGGVSTVGRNTFKWDDWRIQGYARPKYGTSTGKSNKDKTVKELAEEVMAGLHGNGNDRKASLGSRYQEVQNHINGQTEPVDIDQLAKDVINNKYGNGDERKQALGKDYEAVQKRVNELLAEDTLDEVQETKEEAIKVVDKMALTSEQKNEIAQKILDLVSIDDIKKVLDEVLK